MKINKLKCCFINCNKKIEHHWNKDDKVYCSGKCYLEAKKRLDKFK